MTEINEAMVKALIDKTEENYDSVTNTRLSRSDDIDKIRSTCIGTRKMF